jgi:ligand-binding SRPBCC domain-containing protein
MTTTREVFISSIVAAPRSALWEHISTPALLNREFSPFLKMTFPKSVETLTPQTVPLGQKLCRSWILLFGLLPVEYDDVTLVEIEPGVRFVERSSMLTQSFWEHIRTLEDADSGCRVTDRVRFVSRLSLAGPLQQALVKAIFAWRHKRLTSLFG